MDWRASERGYDDDFMVRSTLPIMFERAASRYEDRIAQQYKGGIHERTLVQDVLPAAPDGEYASVTYDELRGIVRRLAGGLRELGLTAGDRVAIYSDTRMEWAHADLAIMTAGGVTTTIYDTAGRDQVRYLLADSGARGVVVENEDLLENVFAVESDLDLDFVVSIDHPGKYAERPDVYTLADLYDLGDGTISVGNVKRWLGSQSADDLASIVYTSGTTGQPKGVKLTHWNVRSNLNDIRRRYGPREDKDALPLLDEETTTLSFLPLAHILERVAGHFLQYMSGATVAYAESADTLGEDFALVQPNMVTCVPRVYEKLYDAMREQASESGIKKRIFEWAIEVAHEYGDADQPTRLLQLKHQIADRLVYSTVRDAVGGNVELFISGGGTLSPDLCGLYHVMGLPIYEGYGLTETSPGISLNPTDDPKIGTVGAPLLSVDVKVDKSVVPEGEFEDAMGEVGELLVRGPNVFSGYWNKPDATAEAFEEDEDGKWFRTGDIVTIRRDGYLTFHERAKQLIVLSTGKNVAPAPIEDSFADSDVVRQAMVVGDEEKFVSALLVPNVEGLRSWATGAGVELPDDADDLCEHDRVHERIAEEVERINERFDGHEQIGDFRLVPEGFTQENGLLTPTMKKKRHEIRDRYRAEIEEMYGRDRARQPAQD